MPTGEENNWVRTGRGFLAQEAYKKWKNGTKTMKTISVQVHEDEDISRFLDDVASTQFDHSKRWEKFFAWMKDNSL